MAKAKLGVLATAIIAKKGMTKEEKFQQNTVDTIEDYIIETESAISEIKVGCIPRLESELKRAVRAQAVAKKGIEEAYMSLGNSYSSYISEINSAKKIYEGATEKSASIRIDIKQQKDLCAEFESLLSKLKA